MRVCKEGECVLLEGFFDEFECVFVYDADFTWGEDSCRGFILYKGGRRVVMPYM